MTRVPDGYCLSAPVRDFYLAFDAARPAMPDELAIGIREIFANNRVITKRYLPSARGANRITGVIELTDIGHELSAALRTDKADWQHIFRIVHSASPTSMD